MTISFFKLYSILNKYRKYIPILIDTCIAVLSYLVPFLLSGINPIKLVVFKNTFLIYTIIYIGTFIINKTYKNMWRYTGIEDLCHCLYSAIMANLLFFAVSKLTDMNIVYYVYPVTLAVSCACTMA